MFANCSKLNETHAQEWAKSGVDISIIERNVWTIEDSTELDQLLNRNTDRRWKHSDELVPGWAVAGVDPRSGETNLQGSTVQTRPAADRPRHAETSKILQPVKDLVVSAISGNGG